MTGPEETTMPRNRNIDTPSDTRTDSARGDESPERRARERAVNWDLEGNAPPDSYGHGTAGYDDGTDRGYDEAAHRGNAYGVPEGLGGAFGTSGGGTYAGGFQVEQRFGPNAGRGPRGYQRSDERILDDAHERLERDGWVDATEIELSIQNGEIALRGSVETLRMRRRAEEIVDSVSGVRHVTNDLRVRRRGGG
jgi:hypothetical protein